MGPWTHRGFSGMTFFSERKRPTVELSC